MIRKNNVIIIEAIFIILLIISNYFSLFKNEEFISKLLEIKMLLFSVLDLIINYIKMEYSWFSEQDYETSFNNREIALAILIIITILFCLIKKDIRKSTLRLMKIMFGKYFVKVYFEVAIYVCVVCFLLYKMNFWRFSYTKDTILWAIFSGLLLTYRSVDKKEEARLFLNLIKEALGIALVYEFLLNTFTYPVWGELLLFLFLIFIGLMMGVIEIDKNNEKYKPLNKILNNLNIFVGWVISIHLIIEIVIDHATFFTIDTLNNFLLPIILTIAFIPYMYYLTVLVFYDEFWMRVRINKRLNGFQKMYFRIRVVVRCGMSRVKIRDLLNEVRPRLVSVSTVEEIKDFF